MLINVVFKRSKNPEMYLLDEFLFMIIIYTNSSSHYFISGFGDLYIQRGGEYIFMRCSPPIYKSKLVQGMIEEKVGN